MLSIVIFDKIKVLIKSLDIGIASFFKYSYLNPESFVVMTCSLGSAVSIVKYVSPVNLTVSHTELLPFSVCIHFLKVRILLKVGIPSYKETCCIHIVELVTGIDEIRKIA